MKFKVGSELSLCVPVLHMFSLSLCVAICIARALYIDMVLKKSVYIFFAV